MDMSIDAKKLFQRTGCGNLKGEQTKTCTKKFRDTLRQRVAIGKARPREMKAKKEPVKLVKIATVYGLSTMQRGRGYPEKKDTRNAPGGKIKK